ncbi:MAG TPA: hypothetical protein VE780_08250 [Thermoleophilaceae bacterium]|jgi:hypothetical protein|nr:hypothetical protein [Thermoleophilaceae bacterium]
MDTVELELGHPWVAVADLTMALEQLTHDHQAWRLARVVDVGLVGHAKQKHPRATDRPASRVQRIRHLLHHMAGHLCVDLVRGVD